VRDWHAVSLPGHWLAAVHCTQAPAPSHTVPPFWVQGVLIGAGGLDGTPSVHTSRVHWAPSTGTSELSGKFV